MKIPFSAVSKNTSGLVDVASSTTALSDQKELPNEKVQQKNVLQGHSCDIGSFYDKVSSLTDPQIYDLLKNIWKPSPQYVYPIHYSYGKNRKFNSAWLQKFPWLTYSGILDGAFCLPCILFGRRIGSNSTRLNKLMISPFNDWSTAMRKFNDHDIKSVVHKTSVLTMQTFLTVKENKIKPINIIQDKILQDTISANREKLMSIVKIVVLLGQHNISFRRHRHDSKYYDTKDCCNFQALLDFRIDSGDVVLKRHFEDAPRNATFRSKTTQIELISCCANVINEQILNKVKEAKYFSILADEVKDCSNKEQMPLVLRYVGKDGKIQERFLKFIHCDTGLSGAALKDKIVSCITEDFKLDIIDCRGQCYDGAGNMAGRFSGVSAQILVLNPLALYTHCSSHRLNLCIASSCQIQSVRNMMESVTSISNFFNKSPKRQLLLEGMVKKHIPNCKHTKLLDVCRTRWVLRIDGLERFIEMYKAIAEAMFAIKDNVDGKWYTSATEAYALSSLFSNFDFIVTLVVVRMCLGYTRSATVQLQGVHIDIINGLNEISMIKTSLQTARNLIDSYNRVWFQMTEDIAKNVGVAAHSPRICGRQTYRGNAPASDTCSYYKCNLSILFLDHLLQELSTRFSETNCVTYKALAIVPSIMATEYSKDKNIGQKRYHAEAFGECSKESEVQVIPDIQRTLQRENSDISPQHINIQRLDKIWKKDFQRFCEQYEEDLPSPLTIPHEVDNWESFWLSYSTEK